MERQNTASYAPLHGNITAGTVYNVQYTIYKIQYTIFLTTNYDIEASGVSTGNKARHAAMIITQRIIRYKLIGRTVPLPEAK